METRKCFIAAVLALITVACARPGVIPEPLEGQVDRDLRFVALKQNPEAHHGKLVLVGGTVLSAKRREDGTRIEVLQRPLSSDLVPREDHDSHGRFVAIDADGHIIDPAFLEYHELITIVGEVAGTETVKIDQVSEEVPKFRVRHVTVWEWKPGHPGYGYYAPFAWDLGNFQAYPQRE